MEEIYRGLSEVPINSNIERQTERWRDAKKNREVGSITENLPMIARFAYFRCLKRMKAKKGNKSPAAKDWPKYSTTEPIFLSIKTFITLEIVDREKIPFQDRIPFSFSKKKQNKKQIICNSWTKEYFDIRHFWSNRMLELWSIFSFTPEFFVRRIQVGLSIMKLVEKLARLGGEIESVALTPNYAHHYWYLSVTLSLPLATWCVSESKVSIDGMLLLTCLYKTVWISLYVYMKKIMYIYRNM